MSDIGNKPRLDCAVDATMSVIEGRWKATILCKLIMKGTLRFNQLMKEMSGVSPRILTKQLREMERDGLVIREVFPEVPPRVEYTITPRGKGLAPILTAMAQWGIRNMMPTMVAIEIGTRSTRATESTRV
jgi:Predicted transcriptional regulators